MLIAHLSDPHLRAQGQLYQGLIDSNAQFDLAIRHLNALDPAPDLVLVTGDLVDEGSAAEYVTVRRALAAIRQPILVIPGNHDEREAFRACFADHRHLPATGPLHFAVGDKGPVRVLGLDVTVPGRHHGELTDAAGDWLEAALAEEPERPTLLMMHQPPVESGIVCIDAYSCRDGQRLEAIIRRHRQVERLLCGHIHRFMLRRFGGTILLTAPSTTTAIALRFAPSAEPASFLEPPAFLLHQWREPTGFVTHHLPVGPFPGPFPFF
jgi:3',5'-cyclic AMP phosphodiesterase CpdA